MYWKEIDKNNLPKNYVLVMGKCGGYGFGTLSIGSGDNKGEITLRDYKGEKNTTLWRIESYVDPNNIGLTGHSEEHEATTKNDFITNRGEEPINLANENQKLKSELNKAKSTIEYPEIGNDKLLNQFGLSLEEIEIKSPLKELLSLLNSTNEEGSSPEKEDTTRNHYSSLELDAWDIMEANASKEEALGFIKYNIIKYALGEKEQNITDFSNIIDYAKLGKEWATK